MTRLTATMAALLLFTGCSTLRVQHLYDGAERSVEELACVRVPSGIEIAHIDGHRVKRTYALPGGDTQDLYVLPGEHVVKARYSVIVDRTEWDHFSFTSDPALFTFSAEAGGTYEVKHEEPSRDIIERERSVPIDIWIADTQGTRISDVVEKEVHYTRKEMTRPANPGPPSLHEDVAAAEDQTLLQLKAWWMGANEADKNAFLDWIRAEK